ncbi:MAG: glycosyltransferase [bacterium]
MNAGASVIIVTYNSAQTIRTCLVSVANTIRPEDEVLIIDNNSSDNTVEIIAQVQSELKTKFQCLLQDKNQGFSKGCNIGIAKSTGEFIILLNPDTEVFGGWIERLTAHFRYYKFTGAVGPLSNYTIRSQHILTYFPDYSAYLQDAQKLIETLYQRFRNRSIPAKLLIGFCMALRRDLVEGIGGLDEDIFLGDDDLEISWRFREQGYQLRVALDVFINHVGQSSFDTLPKIETEEMVRQGSDALFEKMRKHYSPNKVPHPQDYFGIGWWSPSILKEHKAEEVFSPKLTHRDYNELTQKTKRLLRQGKHKEAAKLLEQALKLYVNDFVLWYTLGSIYLILQEYEQAEFALKNAWSLDFNTRMATTKLLELVARKRQETEEEASTTQAMVL